MLRTHPLLLIDEHDTAVPLGPALIRLIEDLIIMGLPCSGRHFAPIESAVRRSGAQSNFWNSPGPLARPGSKHYSAACE